MPVAPVHLPAEQDLLCEFCGYTLNGLPPSANCPECGQPLGKSVGPDVRQISPWERDRRFWLTTAMVLFSPIAFFRRTTTRAQPEAAAGFARGHLLIASLLFGAAADIHGCWILTFQASRPFSLTTQLLGWLLMSAATFIALIWGTHLAAWLTQLEARYRGFRLPTPVVSRALAFHSACYLPVGIVAAATTLAYQFALRLYPFYWSIHLDMYLYVLSAEVVLGAMYLFATYWAAMRNIMYANH